jgi:Family of unknown function (DUF5681)
MNDHSKPKSQKGQWPKGVSGNPAGRPRGSRNKATLALEALLEEGAEPLISKAMTMALAGDTAAMRLCLERILPARRDRLIHLDLPPIGNAKEISGALSTILTAIGEGQITPGEGETMANILATQTNVFMAEELESRLEKVEDLVTPENTEQ